MFEIKDHDGLARLGVFSVNNKSIKTPNIAVVVNPNKLIIHPKEFYKFGVDFIITNSYIIKRSNKKGDVHKLLNFDGIIYTDSGTYQMFSKGDVEITHDEIVSFQKQINSDIITPLDVFTFPTDDKETAKEKLKETLKRINSMQGNFTAPIQGGMFLDLRKKACRSIKSSPLIYAVGGIVPLMINYDFVNLIKIIITCKKNLPTNVPLHAFGAGHPILFSLLAYAGVDIFDSASYALYAKEGRYLTEFGTKRLEDLNYLPCNCPICSSHSIKEFNEELLARHNLYVIMREINLIRESIREGKLFDLVSSRVRAHPSLYFAFKELLKHKNLLTSFDPIRKRSALFWTGPLSNRRPEIIYAKERLKELGWKEIPEGLKLVYPFGQSEGWKIKFSEKIQSDEEKVKTIIDYQFGKGAGTLIKDIKIKKSKNNRIKEIYDKKGNLLFVVRAKDGFISLQPHGALLLRDFIKKVYADTKYEEFYKQGKDVFAKHVIKADNIKPREEVVIVCNDIVAIGEAVLSSKEMIDFKEGIAVKVRKGIAAAGI